MSASTANVKYGALELRTLYQKYATRAMIVAASLHLGVIGIYYAVQYFSEEDEPVYNVRIRKYSELGPPPSLQNSQAAPAISVEAPTAKPTVGTPVPVPEIPMVIPEKPFLIPARSVGSRFRVPVGVEAPRPMVPPVDSG